MTSTRIGRELPTPEQFAAIIERSMPDHAASVRSEDVTIAWIESPEPTHDAGPGWTLDTSVRAVSASWEYWSSYRGRRVTLGVTIIQIDSGGLQSGEGSAWSRLYVAKYVMSSEQVAAVVTLAAAPDFPRYLGVHEY